LTRERDAAGDEDAAPGRESDVVRDPRRERAAIAKRGNESTTRAQQRETMHEEEDPAVAELDQIAAGRIGDAETVLQPHHSARAPGAVGRAVGPERRDEH
jgi:hypothetical protein